MARITYYKYKFTPPPPLNEMQFLILKANLANSNKLAALPRNEFLNNYKYFIIIILLGFCIYFAYIMIPESDSAFYNFFDTFSALYFLIWIIACISILPALPTAIIYSLKRSEYVNRLKTNIHLSKNYADFKEIIKKS